MSALAAPRRRSPPSGPDGLGRQYAALPLLRGAAGVEVVMVTSRGTGRWVLPKGWAEPGLAGGELAAKEAFEEAGLLGEVRPASLGSYRYSKALRHGAELPCRVEVFALDVAEMLAEWPERRERTRRSFRPAGAQAPEA